jgi:hypothetical protein
MSTTSRKSLLFGLLLAVFFSPFVLTAKAQTTTFAQFLQFTASQDFLFTNNGTGGNFTTIPNGSSVLFLYSNVGGLNAALQGGQSAHLFITPTTTTASATLNGTTLSQPLNQTVVISIIRDTATNPGIGMGTRRNLLTATISTNTSTPGITGTDGGNSGTFSVSTPDHTVVFTSDFLNFATTTQRNMALSFSSIQPGVMQGAGNFLQTLTAAGTGTFATNPVPTAFGPTAASVTIGGRVLTPSGKGLNAASVVLDLNDGTTRYAMTNTFGYYSFPDVSAGQSAVVSVSSKRYSYLPQVLMINEDITDLNFTLDQ